MPINTVGLCVFCYMQKNIHTALYIMTYNKSGKVECIHFTCVTDTNRFYPYLSQVEILHSVYNEAIRQNGYYTAYKSELRLLLNSIT
jgi:hypothetical protein